MLAGKPAFGGDTVSDVLASVLKTNIDLNSLPSDVPAPIRQLMRRCLTRDRKRRLQSIGDGRVIIEDYLENPAGEKTVATTPVVSPTTPAWKKVLPAAAATLVAAGITAAIVTGRGGGASEAPLRLDFALLDGPLFLGLGSSAVLSPDGTRIAYAVGDENSTAVHIRSLDQLDGIEIASGSGQTSAYQPFFSPDSAWLGYVTPVELLKVPVTGGTPLRLCKVDRSRGASWAPDDTIIFTPSPSSPLYRVPATGGEPEQLTTLDESKGEATHRWPQVLPGGEAVLFTSHTQPAGGFDNATIEVLNLKSGERKVVHRGGSYARYVSSGPSGHLVFVSESTLFAAPFDLGKLELTGSPAPVVQDVSWGVSDGGAQYSFSDTGRLAYLRGDRAVPEYPVMWVDRNGRTSPLWEEKGSYANPRLSPDGKRLSMTVLREGNWDIWVYDIERGVSTRLTFEEGSETEQIWSPDGEYIAFSSDQHGPDNLYRKPADGSGDLERLSESDKPQWATSWSADGRYITYLTTGAAFDLWVVPMEGDGKPEEFLSTPFSEANGAFSPDGRWMAYASNESGRSEVYVRPFPARGGKWQVSDGGGGYPRWSRDGRQLFYRTDDGIMVAPVESSGDTFRAGKPEPVFKGPFRGGTAGLALAGNNFADYDVTADGQRFVITPSRHVRHALV
jgi:serine/threonine-protein kinase